MLAQGDAASLKGDVRRLVAALAEAHEEAAASVATLARIDVVKGRMQAAHDTLRVRSPVLPRHHVQSWSWQSLQHGNTAKVCHDIGSGPLQRRLLRCSVATTLKTAACALLIRYMLSS